MKDEMDKKTQEKLKSLKEKQLPDKVRKSLDEKLKHADKPINK